MPAPPYERTEFPSDFHLVTREMPREEMEVIRRMRRYIRDNFDKCRRVHKKAEELHDFVAPGGQYTRAEREYLESHKRIPLEINDMAPTVEAIAGREVTARFRPMTQGRHVENAGWSDVVDEFIRFVRQKSDADEEESDAFRDLVIQAVSWVSWDTDLKDGRVARHSPNMVPIWEMLWDTRARKRNLRDRAFAMRGRWIDFDRFTRMFPEYKEEFYELAKQSGSHDWSSLPPEEVVRNPWVAIGKGEWMAKRNQEAFVVQLQEETAETYYEIELPAMPQAELVMAELEAQFDDPAESLVREILIRRQAQEELGIEAPAETRELSEREWKEFSEAWEGQGGAPFDDYLELERLTVEQAFIVGDKVLQHGRLREGRFTLLPMSVFAHRQQKETRWYGPGDLMQDSQRWTNRFMRLYLELMAVSAKQGMYTQEGTFDDVDEAMARWALPGSILEGNKPPGEAFAPLPGGNFPPVNEALSLARSLTPQAGGVDPYSQLSGQVGDLRRTAASSLEFVKQASSTMLARVYDSLRLYRRESAKVIIAKMIAYHEPEDLAEIVGSELAQYILPKERWAEALEFDIVIDETPVSPTAKQETFEALTNSQMLQLMMQPTPELPEGMIPKEVVVDLLPDSIQESVKEKMRQHIARQRQMMQQMQEQAAPQEGVE